MKVAAAQTQSTLDFAIREINALEGQIATAEDEADAMLWEQARHVVEQLKHASQDAIASKWINAREGKAYTQRHVSYVAMVVQKFTSEQPRPNFRAKYNELANRSKLAVHQSSESAEHYTPTEIVQLVTACLGEIDLDPCSNADKTIPATKHFTVKENGLAQSWQGRVYMNPPYGREIETWVTKLCEEHRRPDGVTEAIALVPARPDTEWFDQLSDYFCCFVAGRLTFGGNHDPAPFPSAIFYLGDDTSQFYHVFQSVGRIWQVIEPPMFAE